MLRILVCGSRHWDDEDFIRVVLHGLLQAREGRPFLVIHGDNGYDAKGKALWGKADKLAVRGADKLAGKVARDLGLKVKKFTPDWDKHGKGAGPIRNDEMLEKGKPKYVIAFADYTFTGKGEGTGTYDMLTKAAARKVPCYTIGHWDLPF